MILWDHDADNTFCLYTNNRRASTCHVLAQSRKNKLTFTALPTYTLVFLRSNSFDTWHLALPILPISPILFLMVDPQTIFHQPFLPPRSAY